jgi:hypothetical protein
LNFTKTFQNPDFNIPEILDIHPLDIYKDSVEREEMKIANVMKNTVNMLKNNIDTDSEEDLHKDIELTKMDPIIESTDIVINVDKDEKEDNNV